MAAPASRSPRTIAAAVGAALLASIGLAEAREPARHGHRAQPVPPSQTAPDVTGTTAKIAPMPDDETLPPLFNLPVASRARMRVCGERWQAKKMAGQAGDEIWRDFATECLSQKD